MSADRFAQAVPTPPAGAVALELHPLRQPPEPHWWPPAPGWWLLTGIILLSLWYLFRSLRQRRQRSRYRREAWREFEQLRQRLPAETAAQALVGECNALMKRVALMCWPRADVAPLNGPEWLAFLNATADADLFRDVDATLPYRADGSAQAAAAFAEATGQWLQRHRAPARGVGGANHV